jgi:hypothetical protein
MAFTTLSNMSIKVPTRNTKNWDDELLATFTSLDAHDHTSGKGVQIPTAGLANDAVTGAKILMLNDVGLEQKDSGGTAREIINLNSSDVLVLSDSGGNELLEGVTTASAVNHLEITNSATGNNPMLSSTGSDSNVGLILGDSNDNEVLILESTASAVNEFTMTNKATGVAPTLQSSGEVNIGMEILDSNGNEILQLDSTASAVNEVKIINAATGNHPTVSSVGNDTDINLVLTAKGSGVINTTSAITADSTINSLRIGLSHLETNTINFASNFTAQEKADDAAITETSIKKSTTEFGVFLLSYSEVGGNGSGAAIVQITDDAAPSAGIDVGQIYSDSGSIVATNAPNYTSYPANFSDGNLHVTRGSTDTDAITFVNRLGFTVKIKIMQLM